MMSQTKRDIELGDEIGPQRRVSPDAQGIAAYVGAADLTEGLFTQLEVAQALGYRGIVVPGPMLTAFLEQFIRAEFPGWRLERLSTTFRIPTIAGDTLVLHAVVTEHHVLPDGQRVVCDLVIEHANGESAVTGVAILRGPQ